MSTSSSNSQISPLANTSTLLFGFLVSALSIFAVFMTFAIVWNRLVARRRAIDAILAMRSPPDSMSQRLRRPRMWDVWPIPSEQLPSWSDVKPVSVQQSDSPVVSLRTTRKEQTMSFWRERILSQMPPEITYLFHRPVTPTRAAQSDTDSYPLSHGSDIQVSLLISMPGAPQSTRRGEHADRQKLPEMVFATTSVLFHDPEPS